MESASETSGASEPEPEDDHVYSEADRLSEVVAEAADKTLRNPSDEQKGRRQLPQGQVPIARTGDRHRAPQGATRSGKNKDTGEEWSIEMPYHYGYIKRTESEADGDHIDVFLGPHLDSEVVFVIDQRRPGDGGLTSTSA
jgi:inorganic pyrophosphatase